MSKFRNRPRNKRRQKLVENRTNAWKKQVDILFGLRENANSWQLYEIHWKLLEPNPQRYYSYYLMQNGNSFCPSRSEI